MYSRAPPFDGDDRRDVIIASIRLDAVVALKNQRTVHATDVRSSKKIHGQTAAVIEALSGLTRKISKASIFVI